MPSHRHHRHRQNACNISWSATWRSKTSARWAIF